MDEELINKVNSYLDSLDRERRKEVKLKAKEAENKRFKLGFVIGATLESLYLCGFPLHQKLTVSNCITNKSS